MIHSATSPNEPRRVTDFLYSNICVWNTKTGEAIGRPLSFPIFSISGIAYSPTGSHVALCIHTNIYIIAIRDWEHTWNQNCQRMDEKDGWVKENGKLRLWVPEAYRHNIKRSIEVAIGESLQCKLTPKVDLEVLDRFSGRGWTAIYKGDAEGSSRT